MTPESADRIYDTAKDVCVGFALGMMVLAPFAFWLMHCATPTILLPNGQPVDPCGQYGTGHLCSDGKCCPVEGDVCGGPSDEPSCPAHMCCSASGSGDWPFGARKRHAPTPQVSAP